MLMRQGFALLKRRLVLSQRSLSNTYPSLDKIIANTAWLVMDKFVRMGIGVGIGAWMARYLGPRNFGILNYAGAFAGLFAAVASLGLDSVVKRELVRFPEQAGLLLGSSFVVKLLAGLTAYALLVLALGHIGTDRETYIVTLIIGSALIIAPALTVDLWFQAQLLSKYTVWVQNACFVTFSLVRVVLIIGMKPVIAFAFTIPLEALTGAFLICFFYSKRSHYFSSWSFDFTTAKALLKESWPLLFASLVIMIYMRIDQLMLGSILGNEAVGIYAAALKLSEVWYFIPMVLASSLFPTLVRRKHLGLTSYAKTIQRYFDLNAGLAYALAIPATFLAPALIHLLYGHQYAGAEAILTVHIWTSIFVFLGVARDQFFVTEGLLKLSFYTTALGAVCNVGLNLVLIPRLGGLGAAITTVIAQATAAYFSTFLYKESRPAAAYMSNSLVLPIRGLLRLLSWARG